MQKCTLEKTTTVDLLDNKVGKFDVNQWYKSELKGELLFSYKGDISPALITEVLETIEGELGKKQEKLKTKKRVYNILVEALQNLYHHIDTTPEEELSLGERFIVFIISKNDNLYRIITGNFIKFDKVRLLKDRIDQVNYLSVEERKSLYKLILNNQEFSEKGGGGLGIIDIARRVSTDLTYNFYKYDEDYAFFTLYIEI